MIGGMKTAAVALLAGALLQAAAADLEVEVRGADGRPAADVVVMVVPAWRTAVPATGTVDIVQQDNRFVPYVTVVPAGTRVRFVNRDRYDHHVRALGGGPMGAVPPARTFELRLGPVQSGPRAMDDSLVFDAPGSITLGCHIHGSMRGHLYVSPTPWVAVTDAQGRARVAGLPDGAAELRLWHPFQLAETPARTLTLAGTASASVQLGFTPPPRPVPRPARPRGDYEF